MFRLQDNTRSRVPRHAKAVSAETVRPVHSFEHCQEVAIHRRRIHTMSAWKKRELLEQMLIRYRLEVHGQEHKDAGSRRTT